MRRSSKNWYKNHSFLLLTYLFSLLLIGGTSWATGRWEIFLFGLLELALIFELGNLLAKLNFCLAYAVRSVLLFVLNAQMAIHYFGGTYLSLIMLSNVGSLKALAGRAVLYLLAFALVVLLSCLPLQPIRWSKVKQMSLLTVVLLAELLALGTLERDYSPFQSLYTLVGERLEQIEQQRKIAALPDYSEEFLQESVENAIAKSPNISDNPNIIMIFVEGLSQHIIDDERNVMPNVAELQSQSINFINYYNHTFATYRGLIGTLFSGYQYDNYEENHFVSLQSVLNDRGYQTTFLNTEPNNNQFTTYLESLGFDDVKSKDFGNKNPEIVFDEEAYLLLLEEVQQLSQEEKPYFISLYTFGTHISEDSKAEQYGDGRDPMLNKFYDSDYQFGQFFQEASKQGLLKDTVIVFTTDHATFVDDSYRYTFSDYNRSFGSLDEVPFFIYHEGVEARTIDVEGRNSVNLTPTVLDYLDMETENYFLGGSLFSDLRTDFDTIFSSENNILTTENDLIQTISDEEKEKLMERLERYFSSKKK